MNTVLTRNNNQAAQRVVLRRAKMTVTLARRLRPVRSNKGFGICFTLYGGDALRTRATHGPFATANLRRWT